MNADQAREYLLRIGDYFLLAESTKQQYAVRLREHGERFHDWERLIDRFDQVVAAAKRRVNSFEEDVIEAERRTACLDKPSDELKPPCFEDIETAHNELCVADSMLSQWGPQLGELCYEPRLHGSRKSIDFRASCMDGVTVWVDVKTIQPQSKDSWAQFEDAKKKGYFPENVEVLIEGSFRGELWHIMVAARARMLEYTLELEQKVREAQLSDGCARFILAFCADAYHLTEDELEDFVQFYRTGKHRSDDPFAIMEDHTLAAKDICLDRTIHRFAYLQRSHSKITPDGINWRVTPPNESWLVNAGD